MSNTVEDRYKDEVDIFEELLEAAETNANNDFEMEFTSDMRVKYQKYGKKMFLSDKQVALLERIADNE